jgi:hypothetical protein
MKPVEERSDKEHAAQIEHTPSTKSPSSGTWKLRPLEGQPFTHKGLPRGSQHPIAVFRYNKS